MITKPKGTCDIYGKDSRTWLYLNRLIDELCSCYNYEFIRTPIFENSELFHRSVGESSDIVKKETYDFKDRSDRSLTLRPEGTAGVVRSFIENKMYGDAIMPKKLYYNGTMYRYERPQSGRFREFTQFGVEALGSDDAYIDAEVISMGYRFLEEAGIEDVTVHINSLGDNESRENYKKALKSYLEPHINELCPDCQSRFKTNPLRILDCKFDKDNEILKNVPNILDYLNIESSKRFKTILSYLDLLDVDYEVDSNIVRGLDYYNHTVFEFTTDLKDLGNANTLGAGGRYNNLVNELGGPDIPAVGMAFGLDRLVTVLNTINETDRLNSGIDVFVMYVNEEEKLKALSLVQDLRMSGLKVETENNNRGLKAQFKEADRFMAKALIILNSDDLSRGLINVKDNITKEETKVDETEIIDYIVSTF